jgi:hypothetical protein
MSSEHAEKTYEMLWDCSYCKTPKLLGLTHRHCPNCGAPQDPTLRYFPSDAEKVAVQDHVYAGADKLCPACLVPNGARANNCGNCGSPLDGGKALQTRADQVHAEGQAFAGENEELARRALASKPAGALAELAVPPPPARSWKLPLLVAFALALMSVLFVTCFWTKSVDLVVTGHTWTREVQIEQLASKSESAWCDAMPGDATSVTRTREARSERQVPDGETCATRRKDNGDGTFKEVKECTPKHRSEPVYDQKCSYRVNRWTHERSEKASGTSTKDQLVWPAVHLASTGTSVGAEREGKRVETYTVTLTDPANSTHDCSVSQSRWTAASDGSRWSGKSGVVTGALDCDSLVPAR